MTTDVGQTQHLSEHEARQRLEHERESRLARRAAGDPALRRVMRCLPATRAMRSAPPQACRRS
jgi:hypothetical protein